MHSGRLTDMEDGHCVLAVSVSDKEVKSVGKVDVRVYRVIVGVYSRWGRVIN